MVTITEKDINFGHVTAEILQGCDLASAVLLGNRTAENILEAQWIARHGECRVVILIPGEKAGEPHIKEELACPLRQLKISSKDSLHFLAIYRRCLDNITAYFSYFAESEIGLKESKKFLEFSLYGLSVLFSANRRQMPRISEELIAGVLERIKEERSPHFDREIKDELGGIGQDWWKNFYKIAREFRMHGFTFGQLLLILRIFLESMKPLSDEPITPEEWSEINSFLRGSH